jgi:aminoglycoside 6'-N-acetyltransferase
MLPLHSKCLILRRLTRADLEPFLAYRNDPEVARFQSWESLGVAEGMAFIAQQELQEIGKPGQWLQIGIVLKESGQLIGDCALRIHTPDIRQATIGITLSRPYHGKGFATEALSALLDYVFVHMKLHRVQADTDPENTSAWKLLERRREGHHHKSLWFKGRWADEYIYAILFEEWLARREERCRCDRR